MLESELKAANAERMRASDLLHCRGLFGECALLLVLYLLDEKREWHLLDLCVLPSHAEFAQERLYERYLDDKARSKRGGDFDKWLDILSKQTSLADCLRRKLAVEDMKAVAYQ